MCKNTIVFPIALPSFMKVLYGDGPLPVFFPFFSPSDFAAFATAQETENQNRNSQKKNRLRLIEAFVGSTFDLPQESVITDAKRAQGPSRRASRVCASAKQAYVGTGRCFVGARQVRRHHWSGGQVSSYRMSKRLLFSFPYSLFFLSCFWDRRNGWNPISNLNEPMSLWWF